ncbi:ABC transporter permease [Paenibacillus sp. B01]|uniref:ABC transporter permease n=1 Tax=Paenibacillus sp. B01 TaxID=2660554 RepID=UPI00129AC9D4|nr:ABC transporter permease [Paenibacillus sp. B01]QGG56300.1 FtsX-like permease family protein [Paenibacillus sp. B01]
MALGTMILRKMASNKWLQLNLWFGLTLCVALFSSMPLYSDAILQRTLQRELQLVQGESSAYPGYVRIRTTVSSTKMDDKTIQAIGRADRFVRTIPERTGLPAQAFYEQRFTPKLKVYGADASEQEKKTQKTAGAFASLSGLEQRVRIVEGRLPADRQDGALEALVTEKFLNSVKRSLGEELIAEAPDKTPLRVVPVGLVATSADADPYLPYLTEQAENSLLLPFKTFEREFTAGGKVRVAELEWRYALDYAQLSIGGIDRFLEAATDIKRYFRGRLGAEEVNVPATATVASYAGKQARLDVTMLSLYSPVMLMLAFYLYMAANLVIGRQKTEIAVLRSRGASRAQIMAAYAAENMLLGAAALAVGPFVGVGFTKLLGASGGFLEFVQRSALEVSLTSGSYRIAALAVGGAILLVLFPAFLATRVDIVAHKQRSARQPRMSFWHKTGIDLVLIALAGYLLYNFGKRQEDLKRLALDQDALQIDPLLFLMPAMFALGGGLLLLRVYPWLLHLLYRAGRRWWPPSLYHTLVQISRSSGQYLTIQVFLIMTVSTGLFSANAARTINDNMESKIRYAAGADIALSTRWASDAPPPAMAGAEPGPEAEASSGTDRRVQYTEPPFEPFANLEGAASAAKVFRSDKARFAAGKTSGKTTLMGIETKSFGETAWMKDGLLEHPINSYLNLIAPNPKAVLISRSLADKAKAKPGDAIRLSWDGLDQAAFTVYGIVDYWPSWSPLKSGEPGKEELPYLVVGHLSAIQNRLAVEPYEVWLKLADGAASQDIYDELAAQKLSISGLTDANRQLAVSNNDPFRLAINGVMTLGFVISMLICFFGFLLFWLLTLSGRTLQYGVLGAMGIPFRQIILMLVSEQLLTSGAAALIGVLIGGWSSELFVPMFEMSFATTAQVPPFTVVYRLADYLQLYSLVGITLAVGLLVLGWRLSRIRIAQALKLGEE